MGKKTKQATTSEEVEFLPLREFQEVAKRIFSNSKEDSDKQLAEFQLSNEHHKSIEARKKKAVKKKSESL